jgi:hypothetical protein
VDCSQLLPVGCQQVIRAISFPNGEHQPIAIGNGAWTLPGNWESVEVHCDRLDYGDMRVGILAAMDEETLRWHLRQKAL